MEEYEELLVELECPICTNYMSPPIRQCSTGHSICEPCRMKLPKCALCQGKFTDSRNISLEGLAVKMRYPCINKTLGCRLRLSFNERELHEMRCSYKGFKCGMEKCTWVGQLEDLRAHWNSKKISSKPYHKTNICHTKMKNESYYVNMVDAHNKLFWFKCKIANNKIFWAVQYIGNSAEAENFYYEIEIFKPGQTKKRIILSDYCQSNDLENSQLFKEYAGCVFINADALSSFVSTEQLLIYYFRVNLINEVEENAAKQQTSAKKELKIFKPRDRSKGPASSGKKKPYQLNNFNPTKKCDDFVML